MTFGRLERPSGARPMSDINMTPLVDVMLVLVVILLLTAPLLSSSIRLNLPHAQGEKASTTPATLQLAVDARGQTFLEDRPITEPDLQMELRRARALDPETEVQLHADVAVPYGRVVEIMGWAHAAGLSRIGFVTDPQAAAIAKP